MVNEPHGTVLVTGIFNVLHPGHVRLLRFARSLGSSLTVGVLSDDLAVGVATKHESHRLEAVQALRAVDEALIVQDSVNDLIGRLRPDVVVKGREHSDVPNPEEQALQAYGGRLVFSSGDSFFSATDLIESEADTLAAVGIRLPEKFLRNHGITSSRLARIVQDMQSLRVLVVGDVIVDEYVSCHPLGMSREDPTLVVTPIETRRFLGGAGIVAGHAGSLGRSAAIYSVIGADKYGSLAEQQLESWGVDRSLITDAERPTTVKQRFRAGSKTLLRVSHLRQDSISKDIEDRLLAAIAGSTPESDLLIFSDFNYGVLTPGLVDGLTSIGKRTGLTMAADSQTSSQVGDVSRFAGMHLLTPTEYEARVAVRNFEDGLVVLADQLREASKARMLIMTLAEDGVLIRGSADEKDPTTDTIPALNTNPIDVAGAGDSLLVVASMAIAAGANLHEAAVLGSVAAGLQVSATGNQPMERERLLEVLRQ
jgi:rfaE bifunctional protein kinase chain/domain